MPDLLVVLFVFVAVVALWSLVDGVALGWGLWRFARCKARGSKLVDWPQELRVAAANGLMGVGSELVVGQAAEWEGAAVKRYSIAMADCGEEAGTVLRVIGMGREKLEVEVVER